MAGYFDLFFVKESESESTIHATYTTSPPPPPPPVTNMLR